MIENTSNFKSLDVRLLSFFTLFLDTISCFFRFFFLVSDRFVQFNALVSMAFFHTAFVSSDFDVSLNEIVCYFSNCLAHHTMINHNVVVQCSQLRQLTYVTSPWIIPPKWLNKEIRCWIIHFFFSLDEARINWKFFLETWR